MRTCIALVIVCSLAAVGRADAEEPVSFVDAALKAAVEDELWAWDPTPTDMLGLTSLDAASQGIADLTGLEYAANLQQLTLRWNRISDMSPLAWLTNLQYLDIHDNHISDVSPLAGLTDLRTLIIRFNRISDISALLGLTSLETADLRGNPLSQEACDVHVPQIIANNPGIDLRYDAAGQRHLLVSSTAGGSVIRPGIGEFLYDNGALVYLEARPNPGYTFTGWSGSFTSTRNPAYLTMDADHNVEANFAGVPDPNATEDPVAFSDVALKRAVEEALSVLDPTATDMRDLPELTCTQCGIVDLTGLEYAVNLWELDLSENQIADISPLSELTGLGNLDLRGNPLNQEAHETIIPLVIAHNPGITISYDPLVQYRLSISSTLGGSVTLPGEGEFVREDGQAILLKAKADPGFVFVGWSGDYEDAANPVLLSVPGDLHIQANFAVAMRTLYVDDDAPEDPGPGLSATSDPNENGTSEHPFDTIQEAIDDAAEGTTVIVRPGTYDENINLLGKGIQLAGIDPDQPDADGFPILHSGSAGPTVSFISGEDPNCQLVGFVITAGAGQEAGAIVCIRSSPTVANCLIVGNRAIGLNGAAVYCIDSRAVFDNCAIADNFAGEHGAGIRLIDSHIVLTNSIVWGNVPSQIILNDGSEPLIAYTDIAGGWPGSGNIDADPLFAQRGHWASQADPSIPAGPADLDAIWVMGDYHLRSQFGRWDPETGIWVWDEVTSPCIDGGNPAVPVGAELEPNGGVINIGAYAGTSEASKTHPQQ